MIELGKKYRTRGGWPAHIHAVDEAWAWGQVDLEPIRWHVGCGVASWPVNPSNDLIEVKPEVTTKLPLFMHENGRISPHSYDSQACKRMGDILLTHDGEKLLKVEIVK